MSGGYYACGKQILWGKTSIADAKDNETAQLIADALNSHPEALPDHSPVMPEIQLIAIPGKTHGIRQENDEFACSCGARWAVNEGEQHP